MPPPSLNDFLTAAPRLDVQLTLTVVLAVFWFAVFRVCTLYVVKPYIDAHPMSQQFAFLNQKMLKNGFAIDFDLQRSSLFGCRMISILVQHAVGGFLCIFSAYGVPIPAYCSVVTLASFGGAHLSPHPASHAMQPISPAVRASHP